MDTAKKIIWIVILALLTVLAVSSGVSKIILMQQEVDFFSKYGFSNPMLVAFGITQVVGGILLPFAKTRFIGAAVVAMTFLISLILLVLEGNVPMSAVTLIVTLALGLVMFRSRTTEAPEAPRDGS